MKVQTNLSKYFGMYRRHIGRRLYVVFGFTAAAALAEGLGITMLLPLLRAIDTGGNASEMGAAEQHLHDLLAWAGLADSVVGILLFIACLFVAKGVLKFAEEGYRGYLQSRLLRELKSQLFDAYSTMKYRHYLRRNTGHFINVINDQVNRFFRSFEHFAKFVSQVIITTSYFAFAFVLTWRFALMAVGVGLVLLILFRVLNRYVRRLSRRTSAEMSQLNKLLVQSLQSFKYIAATGQTDRLRSGVMNSIRRFTGYQLRQRVARGFTLAAKEPASVLLIVAVIAMQVIWLQEPLAPIFVSLLLFHRGMQAVVAVQGEWQSTMDMIGSVEMVDDELREVLEHKETSGPRKLGRLRQAIEFRSVYFAYDGNESDVLHDISVTIPVNTTVAFVGESGAGKSTLIDMIPLMLRPQQGDVYIDGIPGREVDLASWRAQIGYVSQETVVFDDTVANNIGLWAGDMEQNRELKSRVEQAARQAHAHHFIEGLPDGYQTIVGERGVRLSGGQRQRLFIARELFKRPNVLILDEATSALDTESERYIQESIDALKGSMTVIIIAHRLSTIKNVDRIFVLEDGHLVEEGNYEALTNRPASRFREMVEMQSL